MADEVEFRFKGAAAQDAAQVCQHNTKILTRQNLPQAREEREEVDNSDCFITKIVPKKKVPKKDSTQDLLAAEKEAKAKAKQRFLLSLANCHKKTTAVTAESTTGEASTNENESSGSDPPSSSAEPSMKEVCSLPPTKQQSLSRVHFHVT